MLWHDLKTAARASNSTNIDKLNACAATGNVWLRLSLLKVVPPVMTHKAHGQDYEWLDNMFSEDIKSAYCYDLDEDLMSN